MDDFEKKWQRIQDALGREYAGDVQPRVSSTRTLFGIKSEAEQKIEQFAREINDENLRKLKEQQGATNGPQMPEEATCSVLGAPQATMKTESEDDHV